MNWKNYLNKIKKGDKVKLLKTCGPDCEVCNLVLGTQGRVISIPGLGRLSVAMDNGTILSNMRTQLFKKVLQ